MIVALLVASFLLGLAVLALGFLVLGTLRALGVLSWRLEQLEATTPSRLGRDGLKVGKRAPDFTLPSVVDGGRSLHDFSGRKVLLVFTQTGCGPCHAIAPELNHLHEKGEYQVLVVNNGESDETRKWTTETGVRFPVLVQEKFSLSKRYQVLATPFAFVIDENGIITSKGIAGSRQHLGYVLAGGGNRAKQAQPEESADESENHEVDHSFSSKEVTHV